LKFEKRSQFFVGGDDESLSVVAVCISNEDRLSVGINRCDAAPTPTRFAEIVSDDFPELHVDRIVPLLVSTQQSQNDMYWRNDAGDNIRHCRDCGSLLYPAKYLSARDCAPGPNTLAAALLPSSFRNKDFAAFFSRSDDRLD
jgi:hypothetical protein